MVQTAGGPEELEAHQGFGEGGPDQGEPPNCCLESRPCSSSLRQVEWQGSKLCYYFMALLQSCGKEVVKKKERQWALWLEY